MRTTTAHLVRRHPLRTFFVLAAARAGGFARRLRPASGQLPGGRAADGRSRNGFLAALLLLLAFPLAVLCQIVVGAGADTVVHVVGGAGFVLLARSFFDVAPSRWAIVAGAASAAGMGAIFLLQGLSTVLPSDALNAVAFDLLGDLPERVLIAVLLVALIAACLHVSRGATRWLGLLALLLVAGLHAWRLYAQSAGIPQPAELRLVYLLPFVWLLLASRQPRAAHPAPRGAPLPGKEQLV